MGAEDIIHITSGSGKIQEYPEWNKDLVDIVTWNDALFKAGTAGLNILKLSSTFPKNTDLIKENINLTNIYEGQTAIIVESRAYAYEKGQKAVACVAWTFSANNSGRFIEIHGNDEKKIVESIKPSLDVITKDLIKDYNKIDYVIESITCKGEPVCAIVQAVYGVVNSFTLQPANLPNNLEKVLRFNKERIYIDQNKNGMYSLFAKKDFGIGEIVLKGFGEYIDKQGYDSFQIGPNQHIDPLPITGKFLKHSCEPNLFLNSDLDKRPVFIASEKIEKNKEVSYPYWESEFSFFKDSFEENNPCYCSSENCKGKILSFSELNKKTKEKFLEKRKISTYLLNLN